MADRFPLIVNSVSKKIEELVSGDNLDLTGNGVVVSGDTGAGKYLTSNGTTVFWDSPGDVYLTQNQTLTNKTFETCILSGSLNTITNISNASLSNSSITINGAAISLGGSVTTPDNNTTYAVSAVDGASATEKIIRLTSGGNVGAGIDDDVTLAVGPPASVPAGSKSLTLFLDRSGDLITVSGHVLDSDTITTLNASGGSATSGAINFTNTGAATVTMTGNTINVDALDTDTKTKIRAGSGGTYGPADTTTGKFTFLDGTGTVVAAGVDGNGDPTITYTSTDTVTRIRGGSTGSYVPASGGTTQSDITITGGTSLGGNVTVSQSGNTIEIDSTDTNTVTKLGSDNNGSPIAPQAGDFIFKQAGATTIRQTTNNSGQIEIEIDSLNSDTGASLDADPVGGLILSGTDFQLKNYNNLTGNKLVKWDSGNNQLSNSIINDDGTTVTIGGDLVVDGTQTILNTTTLQVEDNIIELRKGTSITGADGGIQVNRITDSGGVVTAYQGLQWHESGGYWRSWDGSVDNRFVTENETQVLTNKTLTNPTFTTPTLGAATATSVNGLEITSTASAVLDIQSGKTVDIDRDLTFTSDNLTANVNVNFRVGGDVAYKSDTLASFSSTTATQLRTLISGTTGTDDLVFQTSPVILTSLVTTSTGFALLNSGAQSIQFGGAATVIDIGNQSGTTTISGDTVIEKDLTVGGANTDLFTCNARIDIANSDILIRGGSTDPMTVGRGTSAVATNTAVGKQALFSVSSGSQNTATGYESLLTANTGAGNSAYGYHTLRSNGVGVNNTAVGRSAMLSNLSGDSNTVLGANALETNTTGDANVCIGFYAGYNCSGTGNVLIGPADSSNPVNDVTYTPPNASGDRQLIIGSGTEYWVKGDSNFDVTLNNDVTVNNSLTVKGDFVVNGVQTVVKSNVLEVADKNIELAKVVSTQFTCTTTDGSANISSISPTLGLIPGMAIISNTAGVTVPGNTTIVSITGNTATLSNNVTGSGTPTFSAIGPSDTAADGGGIILKGSPSDHTFTWSNANDAWQSSEDMELVNGKTYNIIDGAGNARQMISLTQIGPTAGTGVVATLGTGVTGSSLTSVGTLSSLTVSGNISSGTAGGNITIVDNNLLIKKTSTAGNGVGGITIGKDASGTDGCVQINSVQTGNDTDQLGLVFLTHPSTAGSAAPEEALRIEDTGQVGIGTDNPTELLSLGFADDSSAKIEFRVPSRSKVAMIEGADDTAAVGDGNVRGSLRFITRLAGNENERMRITSDGKVGINIEDNTVADLQVREGNTGAGLLRVGGGSGASIGLDIDYTNAGTTKTTIKQNYRSTNSGAELALDSGIITFRTGTLGEEKARITSTGEVNIGGDYSQTDNHVHIVCPSKPIQEGTLNLKSSTTTGAADTGAVIRFSGHSGTEDRYHASIKGCKENGTSGNYAGYLAFNTRPNGQGMVERVRIRANGDLTTKQEASENRQTAGFTARKGDSVQCTRDSGTPLEICRTSNTGAFINFFSGSSAVASISFSGGIMTYGGQSDYRLKENIVEMTGGIDAVKKLNPIKFNFISSPENTLEGFIAHEVQEVIPQAVVGEKDAEIDEEGKGYQQMDPVHLVPTLTKALQEAIAKIETLEAKVAQLEGN